MNMNNMSNMNNTGSGMDGDMGMSMMMMFFHTGFTEFILFEKLLTSSKGEFAGACIVMFVVSVLYELLKYLREELGRRHNAHMAHILKFGTNEEKAEVMSTSKRIFSRVHIVQTLLHAVQVFISYCLMLVIMSYNAYLCLSIVLGATVGYFATGWNRAQVIDQGEHCH